jgi:hypothetical protein
MSFQALEHHILVELLQEDIPEELEKYLGHRFSAARAVLAEFENLVPSIRRALDLVEMFGGTDARAVVEALDPDRSIRRALKTHQSGAQK